MGITAVGQVCELRYTQSSMKMIIIHYFINSFYNIFMIVEFCIENVVECSIVTLRIYNAEIDLFHFSI